MNPELLPPTSCLNSLFHNLVFVIKKMNNTGLSRRGKNVSRQKCNKIIIFTVEMIQNENLN